MVKTLLVDDNEYARELTLKYLRQSNLNIEAHEAGSGLEAKEKIAKNAYDLIFLDIIMPDINGIEVLKYIRDIDKDVKVVITSATGSEHQIKRAFEAGTNDFLVKPIDLRQLVTWVNMVEEQKH